MITGTIKANRFLFGLNPLSSQKRLQSAWIWRVENQTKLQFFVEKLVVHKKSFLWLCVCHWNYMKNFSIVIFCSFSPSLAHFSSFLLNSVKTYFIMLLCKGVLEINSWIEEKAKGNLFIDSNSFRAPFLTPSY